jgi:hypothetical protein
VLLLIDALERHDPTELEECETPVLINLYTLLSYGRLQVISGFTGPPGESPVKSYNRPYQ